MIFVKAPLIGLAQDRDKWRPLVKAVMNLQAAQLVVSRIVLRSIEFVNLIFTKLVTVDVVLQLIYNIDIFYYLF
jgi:hypothetical protein